MLGNAALMERPKVAFLSSRRVAPATVMRCYDGATEMRGGGRGATALPDGGGTPSSGEAARVPLPRKAATSATPPVKVARRRFPQVGRSGETPVVSVHRQDGGFPYSCIK